MADLKVLHQQDREQFIININEQQALLTYNLYDDRVVFTHTFVPDSLRGQGLAEKLVRSGLSWANSANLNIEASCWYVQKFL
ncbi:GNAT family N-acetyltransferase [Shewanella nanhaiensis]|uniref:N-acetyltransferase n=1 Tax=Shewanella nanhaiensis TaxID=2864872 RepID=A0ABS7E5U6_9GAMM|nr:GNAT family N-acetyltransferase [Shewanella nanhaiensis]MBW8184969.1 N-acetyltransferase [Shewanella nanhaiensis]